MALGHSSPLKIIFYNYFLETNIFLELVTETNEINRLNGRNSSAGFDHDSENNLELTRKTSQVFLRNGRSIINYKSFL